MENNEECKCAWCQSKMSAAIADGAGNITTEIPLMSNLNDSMMTLLDGGSEIEAAGKLANAVLTFEFSVVGERMSVRVPLKEGLALVALLVGRATSEAGSVILAQLFGAAFLAE